MQLTATESVECEGKVKYSGIDTGNVPWKNGKLIVFLSNGTWRMNLEYDVNKGSAQKSYILTPSVIKKLICKAQLVIELHPDGRGHSQQNLHLKPQYPHQIPAMTRLFEKLKEIQMSDNEPVKARAEVKMSPIQMSLGKPSPAPFNKTSPETFTSVKSKDSRKRLYSDDGDEETSKENNSRLDASQKFLERGCDKSKNWLSGETTPIKFYGHSTPVNTYAAYSAKRTPGLMPDPAKRRLGDIKYSWIKPTLTAPSGSHQQQSLHGFSNLGNTCYMNAILQSLVNLDTFTTDLLYGNKRMLRTLEPTSLYKCMELVFNSRLRNVPDFSKREYLKNLKQAISSSAKRFSGYQQHDAHEFLGQLLDQLKEEVTKISKSTPSPHRDGDNVENSSHECINPTVQNFEFEVIHRIKCDSCGEEVTKEEQFNDLSVDMPRSRDPANPRSLQDALELSLRKESIEYTCEKCNSAKSTVTHKFTKLPRVLVLHLKRYSYNMMMSKHAKAGQNITIPRYLTLQSHCEEETRPPYPTIPPPEPKSLSVPDSPLREKNENTPRRRLDAVPGFRFKKSRALPNFDFEEDTSKTSTQQTSTPNKKPSDESDLGKTSDKKLTIDDEVDDPELAKALELSLKEASDRAEGYLDEVDGMMEDGELKRVLEMSRQENEHDYGKNIRLMTEDEQMELAMRQSIEEFENQIKKECGSAVAEDIFTKHHREPDEMTTSPVKSKYFKSESESTFNSRESNGNVDNCDGQSMYELTENSYFPSSMLNKELDAKDFSTRETTSDGIHSDNVLKIDNLSNDNRNENETSSETEVMLISDNTDSESEMKSDNGGKTVDLNMEVSDTETREVKCEGQLSMSGLKRKCEIGNTEGKKEVTKKSKDIENILLVDEMTSGDITPIRTIERKQSSETPMDSETNGNPTMDVVDLFCNEDDDLLISQWDKENYNPESAAIKEEEEMLPRIDNEKGDLPYSYRLVSIVNHIGSSSVVGHYISDVYDIKKSCWFSCDDSHVSRTAETEVRSKRERTGYIFFYLHKDIFDDLKDHYAIHAANKREIKS